MAIKLAKVKEALESTMLENDKPLSIQQKLDRMFGVSEKTCDCVNELGQVESAVYSREIDPQAAKDLDNIGPAAIGRTFCGREFERQAREAMADSHFFPRCRVGMSKVSAQESDSPGVSASMMEPISTWGSFTLGLYDFKILEGYTHWGAIYEEVVPTVPTLIHGAQKHMRSDYDGTVNLVPLAEGQAADTVGQKPAWVWSQPVDEFQLQYSVSMEALLSDLSGQLQAMGTGLGESLKKAENYRAGRVFMGYKNTYCFNTKDNSTPSCNTFQSTAGSAPFDYANLYFSNGLLDVDTLNTSYLNMLALRDPIRGWRLDPGKDFTLLVSPDLVMKASEIVKLVMSYRSTQYGVSPGGGTNIGRVGEGPNPLVAAGLNFEVKSITQEWKDVLTGTSPAFQVWEDYTGAKANSSNINPITGRADAPGALMSAANAAGFWMLVASGKKYAIHEPWIPMRTSTYPLTGDELARRVGLRGDAYVASRFTVLEPRYAQINLPTASNS